MLIFIVKRVFLLQIILLTVWFLGALTIPIKTDTFLGVGFGEFNNNSYLWSRANFDGFHYLKIARDGYQYLQQAFFPFYPILIKSLRPIFGSYSLAGLAISNFCFPLSLWLLAKLFMAEGTDEKTIKSTLTCLIFFPTAFFFTAVYTESLFLFLALLSLYLGRKEKWLFAGLVAALASYTRLVGIFLLPALLVEYYALTGNSKNKGSIKSVSSILKPDNIKNLLYIFTSSLGLIKYSYYLKLTQGDWLYFMKVQASFGAQRSVDKMILIYQTVWRYVKMIFTVYPKQWLYFNVWQELLISLLFLGLLIFGWIRREKLHLRSSWLVFASFAYFIPTLTGTFSSMPRYILVCFPCFLILAQLTSFFERKVAFIGKILIAVSVLILIVSSALFFRGYWLA